MNIVHSYYRKDGNKKLLVFLHGFMSDPTEDGRFTEIATSILDHGWNSVIIQYEGKLRDYSTFTLSSAVNEIESFINDSEYDYTDISLLGYSLGGTISTILLNRHPEIPLFISYAGYIKKDIRIFGNNDLVKLVKDNTPVITNKLFNEEVPVTIDFCKELLSYNGSALLRNYTGKIVLFNSIYDQLVTQQETYECLNEYQRMNLAKFSFPTDHSFGGWKDHPFYNKHISDLIVDITCEILTKFNGGKK